MIRVIVNDVPGTEHATGVASAIIYGYNGLEDKQKYPNIDISDQIAIRPGSFDQTVEFAKGNSDIIAIVRSTSGIKYMVDAAKTVYPRVQSFVPMGSNSFYDMKLFTDPNPPVIVTCGCGDDENRNNTGYGNGLEFWDTDWQWAGGPDASSYANGWIAGKMLRLYDELKKLANTGQTWWDARFLLRTGCWRIEPNRTTYEWDFFNGFGRPNLDQALSLIDNIFIPPDPYYTDVTLGDIGKLSGVPLGSVKIFIEPVKNAIEYSIVRNGEVIRKFKSGQELSFIDNLELYGTYVYSYFATGLLGDTVNSNKISVIYQKGYHPRILVPLENVVSD